MDLLKAEINKLAMKWNPECINDGLNWNRVAGLKWSVVGANIRIDEWAGIN